MLKIILIIVGVGCILYALYDVKPGDSIYNVRDDHTQAFVIGLILIIFSFLIE